MELAPLLLLLFAFTLAVFLGFELIAKVPSQLHTPLMSGSNAISGITVVGALLALAENEPHLSAALGMVTALLERRGNVDCVMLLTTPTGRPVSKTMLRSRYDEARAKAAIAHPALSDQIKAMYLRDSRKRAADLAEDDASASALLQHSSVKLTTTHYRRKGTELKAVR